MAMFSKQELEVIRRVAQAVVTRIVPAEKPYFQVVWDEFLAQGLPLARTEQGGIPAGLFIDGHAKLKLKTPLIDLIVAKVYAEVKQEFGPPEKEAIRKATIAAADCLGTPKAFAEKLGEQIPAEFLEEFDRIARGRIAQSESGSGSDARSTPGRVPECVAYYREPGDNRLKRITGSAQKLQAQFFGLQRSRFTVLVDCVQGGVWIAQSPNPVSLEPRIRNLLALLLLRLGHSVPSANAFRWAWPSNSPIRDDEKLIRSNLKIAIHALKQKLTCVQTLQISKLLRGEDYCCQGDCTFCVLLTGRMDADLNTPGLRPDAR
jgi:hypothetical protein